MKYYIVLVLCFLTLKSDGQDPAITSWLLNQNGATNPSYPNFLTNVQDVCYTSTDVYVSCTCIPGYDIGPWVGNPNTPANKNFVFKISLSPQENTGNKTKTSLGHIGVWTNGVSIFNAEDGMSYNNQSVWFRDALYFEGGSFDNCLGHPAGNGEYHHHVNPTCLYDDTDNQNHSPIIGYSFDNFPIYGAYGFANTDGTGVIKRMESSYQLRNILDRTVLPDGTQLNPNQYGPAINNQYPLGAYIEDNEFFSGLGDLDEYNGRFCITPDYPNGIYAYFVTVDANLDPVYPYTPGPYYYGIAQSSGNLGPQSGHHTIPNNCTSYVSTPSSLNNLGLNETSEHHLIKIVDIVGRSTKFISNKLLFYIYDDGTVEKRIIVE